LTVVVVARRVTRALREQRRLLTQIALASGAQQAAFVKANQASGQALVGANPTQRGQQMTELANILSQLATSQDSGRWSNGAYFQNGNAVIPGGPSLIDGKLFVPGLRV